MIALLLLISGVVAALYGHLCIKFNPVGKKADGLIVALIGYAMAATGLIVAVAT